MTPPRKFDWDEAARLRAEGWTYRALAGHFGVTLQTVQCALNPDQRARNVAKRMAWRHDSVCPDCGSPTTRRPDGESRRCYSCSARFRHSRAAAELDRLAADLARVTAERDALLVVRDAMQSQLDAWFVAHPHPPEASS